MREDGGSAIQAVVFDRASYNVVSAKKWLKERDMKTSDLAKKKKQMDDAGKFGSTVCLSGADFKLDEAGNFPTDKDGQEKREIVMTAFQEGPGNQVDNRWYSAKAVKDAGKLFESRKKFFYNHLRSYQDPSEEDIKGWCATLMETWVETDDETKRVVRKVRLKIHDEWLWIRCKEAPGEIALSIEGKGAGHEEEIEGQRRMVIEKIWWLNAVKFVNYPGNASMGADAVESAAQSSHLEDAEMKMEELTVEQLKDGRPDLVETLTAAITEQVKKDAKPEPKPSAPSADDKAELMERFDKAVGEVKTEADKRIKAVEEKLAKAEQKADAFEVREALTAKKVLVAKLISESNLPDEAKTERLTARLEAVTEKQSKDKDGKDITITVTEGIKAEIEELSKLIGGKEAVVEGAGGKGAEGAGEDLTEEEKGIVFNHTILKEGPSLADFRASKKAAADKAAK